MSVQQEAFNTNPQMKSPNQSPGRRGGHLWVWIAGVVVVAALAVWAGSRYLPWGQGTTDTTLSTTSLTSGGMTLPAAQPADAIASDATQAAMVAETSVSAVAEQADVAATDTATIDSAVVSSYSRSIVAVARNEETALWTIGSDSTFTVLPAGTELTVTGQSDDGLWLYAQTGTESGWVSVDQVFAFDYASLPVVELGATTTVASVPVETDLIMVSTIEAATTDTATVDAVTAEAATTEAATDGATTGEVMATVILTGARLNVRSGPGTTYAIIGKAVADESFVAVGRDATGDWIAVELTDVEGGFGWVASAYVTVDEPITTLPTSTAVNDAAVVVWTTAAETAATPTATTTSGSTAGSADLTGTLVFQSSGGGMIYAYDLATGALWQVTTGFDPSISPDGQTVAFVRDGGDNGIYLVDIDGSNERRIYAGSELLSSPKWSTDGAWILFSRNDDAELSMAGPMRDDTAVSKDYNYVLSVIDVNGQEFHDIASLLSSRAPDWSADGIVYQSDAGLQLTSDTPNTTSTSLISDYLKPYFYDPDWQPYGDRIVYQGMEASHWEIFSIFTDGTGVTALTHPATTLVDEIPSNVAPAWSPDGQHIVFLSNRQADGTTGAWRLWVMDADGSNQRVLPITVDIQYTFGAEQVVDWGVAT